MSSNGSRTGDDRRGRGKSIPVDWEGLARSTAHPLRVSVLEILGMDGGRTLSPNELSLELQIPLSNTNYHVTELAKAGLIVLVRTRQVRGATEHFYELPEARERRRKKARHARSKASGNGRGSRAAAKRRVSTRA